MTGVIKAKLVKPSNIIISDISEEKLKSIKDEHGVQTTTDSRELVKNADIIFLSVKPNVYDVVMKGIKDCITENKTIVSIAAGKSIEDVEKGLGENIKLVRAMPNTPAMVGEGMTLLCCDNLIKPQEKQAVIDLLSFSGIVEELEERLMSEVTALTSSSPAYVFIFIEAMADSAVQSGIPRKLAYRLAAQAVLGSAKMVLETGKHPAELKDMVCSPAGTTIEAVAALEREGFRNAVITAMGECTKKAREIGKSK
jgi:pyrroline-5-carboxylate reductase